MSDVAAGPPAGGSDRGDGPRTPAVPPLLFGVLGAASLVALILVLLISGGGGGGDVAAPSSNAAAATPVSQERVTLSISMDGNGSGEVRIAPGDIRCKRSCERSIPVGARVTVVAFPAPDSTFEGWGGGTCKGADDCTFVMDGEQLLTVTFDGSDADSSCDAGAVEIDPACGGDAADADADEPPEDPDAGGAPAAVDSDCDDGRDNDRDGLTDFEQDPDCTRTGSESGRPATTTTPKPVDECHDGIDNDQDGLTDRKQDPDCVTGTTESAAGPSASQGRSDCSDGRDNDGDGLTDYAQDPGCTADDTEAD